MFQVVLATDIAESSITLPHVGRPDLQMLRMKHTNGLAKLKGGNEHS